MTVDNEERGEDGGFSQEFSRRYSFILPAGQTPGNQIPVLFRARDISGFEVQRDTYVVVVQ